LAGQLLVAEAQPEGLPLTQAFASIAAGNYRAVMIARVLRLLTLVALALMPFTMSAAPAKAHAMPQATAEEHCGDHQQPASAPVLDMAQCMLMCAALPASEPLSISPPDVPRAPRQLALDDPIIGIILDIATPPPRTA
jgi:hypothetical protein